MDKCLPQNEKQHKLYSFVKGDEIQTVGGIGDLYVSITYSKSPKDLKAIYKCTLSKLQSRRHRKYYHSTLFHK